MEWNWTPLPHLDVVEGLTLGELLVNALIYALAVIAIGALLVGTTIAVKTTAQSFREGYRKGRG